MSVIATDIKISCIDSWLIDLSSKKLTKETDRASARNLDFLDRSKLGLNTHKTKSIRKNASKAIRKKGNKTRYRGMSLGLVSNIKTIKTISESTMPNVFLLVFIMSLSIYQKRSSGFKSS